MRIAFALPGFHKVDRGAEVALLSVAEHLARRGQEVTVFGSGEDRPGTSYRFRHVPALARERFERFPFFPLLRSDVMWEDMAFAARLLFRFRPTEFDVVTTCSFPFTHLALGRGKRPRRPAQVFVTQNGDWPAQRRNSEYRLFRCDGLVCTNPDYYAMNEKRWSCALIPNGVNLELFGSGPGARARFGLPEDRPVVLMVSALIKSKRVLEGIAAVARVPDAHLVVAGDGPLRDEVAKAAATLLGDRFHQMTLSAADMPALYCSADAFLHMSLLESFGNVFVEAMASGLPIVGHDTPRLRWIVEDAPYLCDTQDIDGVAAAMTAALREGRTKRHSHVDRFGWPAIAAQYEDFFRTLASRAD